ncbi:MAG: adenosylmethionine--8-amino-7-oxononanoate transaminase [Proteobacteria bacterium]|nr:adenosylmethionine--8-amino-7-oxononanoate transaminase [Pseudomonadota bacterium]
MTKKETKQLEQDDKHYIWHPFTQMKDYTEETLLIVKRAKGSYLIDTNGKRYIDGVSSLWVNIHGHRKKEIDRAIMRQVRQVSHSTLLGLSNVPAIKLAKKLVSIAPRGLSRVFFSDNGSTAVEVALKIAFQYWQQRPHPQKEKTRFISLKNAYHGDTLGAVSVGGIDLFHETYRPLLFKTYQAASPYCYRCSLKKRYPECSLACLNQLEKVMKKNHQKIAAMIIEPEVQGAGGMLMSPPGYLKGVRRLCSRYSILLIADEVAVGFGRTGRMFACEHEGVHPDIMAVAKGITGGYLPLAATLTTEEVYQAFLGEYREFKTFFHGHTYTGNQLACAAALANLEIFEKEKALQKLQAKISYLGNKLRPFTALSNVGEVRQKGFMVGIELVKDRKTKEPYPLEGKIGIRVTNEARKRGVVIRPLGNVIVLMPPLSISYRELNTLTEIVYKSILEVTGD